MQQSFPSFSEDDIRRVLGTAEGQTLLKLLNQNGGNALRQAANAVKNGNIDAAKDMMRPLMESPAIQVLVEKINRK